MYMFFIHYIYLYTCFVWFGLVLLCCQSQGCRLVSINWTEQNREQKTEPSSRTIILFCGCWWNELNMRKSIKFWFDWKKRWITTKNTKERTVVCFHLAPSAVSSSTSFIWVFLETKIDKLTRLTTSFSETYSFYLKFSFSTYFGVNEFVKVLVFDEKK